MSPSNMSEPRKRPLNRHVLSWCCSLPLFAYLVSENLGHARPTPTGFSFRRPARFTSVGHEHGQGGMIKQVAGCAAENQLPHAALRVSSFDQQVSRKLLSIDQNDLAGRSALRLNFEGLSGNPVYPQ